MTFNYLGSKITSNKNLIEEVKEQATKASIISGFLKDIIWRNKNMNVESKIRIYKTCVRPILTYATETRAETKRTQQMMTTVEMRILRSISGYSLYDRKTNEEIRNKCGIQDVTKWVKKRRKEWRDHTLRMQNDRLPKIAMKEKPDTTRPLGRPPKRWLESWSPASGNSDTN